MFQKHKVESESSHSLQSVLFISFSCFFRVKGIIFLKEELGPGALHMYLSSLPKSPLRQYLALPMRTRRPLGGQRREHPGAAPAPRALRVSAGGRRDPSVRAVPRPTPPPKIYCHLSRFSPISKPQRPLFGEIQVGCPCSAFPQRPAPAHGGARAPRAHRPPPFGETLKPGLHLLKTGLEERALS